jgi:hypothetical protein
MSRGLRGRWACTLRLAGNLQENCPRDNTFGRTQTRGVMRKAIRWSGDPATRLIGVIFSFIGACLLIAGLFIGLAKLGFINASSTARGTVVRLNAGGSHPEIRFTTASGEVVDYPQGGLIFGYRVGVRVPASQSLSSKHLRAACQLPVFALYHYCVTTLLERRYLRLPTHC